MAALAFALLAAPAVAQSTASPAPDAAATVAPTATDAPSEPTPGPSSRPPQQVMMSADYVFDGHASLRAGMRQIYNRKDGTSIYFGEDFAFFHSTCGSRAFCNNVGGHDSDVRLGFQIAEPDIFLAIGSGNFAGNGASFSGIGLGVEKVPRGEKPFEPYGSVYLYPSASGSYSCPVTFAACYAFPVSATTDFRIVRYTIGGHMNIKDKPFFIDFGYAGDQGTPNTPGGAGTLNPWTFSHNGLYLGAGLKM